MGDAYSEVDDGGLRASLRGIWSSVAPAWGELAEQVDARGAELAEAMLDAGALVWGDHVLEIACGPGGLGIAAAGKVGPEGTVVLSDIAAEMTTIAVERAHRAGLTNITARQLDLERIDCPDSAFDKVLCRDGLMLVPDPAAGAREARRILRPGGRAVFAVWGPRDRNPWLGVLFDAVTAETGISVPPPGMPGPFSLEAPGALGAILAAAGFIGIDVCEISTPMTVESIADWWSVVPALAGPLARLLGSLPAELTRAIRARAVAAMADFATSDGYRLPGVSLMGVGCRPPR
ncbi:class I SAM-dependent methyltransferase [Mycolicibacterium fluoranthenivorans]|uniref:Methyltransferase domain-containing protein n=1 Tax=Mycolicibacterium fluoranthenivorans TaxID=258505 RepID=A0A1G4V4N0_9MYCO|nr:class I SAM-dependent methyltransferase [Mycolicibacterium fluoranthenivorans]SCX01162.1 Methyltransferase domain-containing protein [Mycolicibacterium fluoranthenivorans]